MPDQADEFKELLQLAGVRGVEKIPKRVVDFLSGKNPLPDPVIDERMREVGMRILRWDLENLEREK